jgi:hypothetical protein
MIETGTRSASIITLEKIAQALFMELIIDFEAKNRVEENKTMEGILTVLEKKSDRKVNIIGQMIELLEQYNEEQ